MNWCRKISRPYRLFSVAIAVSATVAIAAETDDGDVVPASNQILSKEVSWSSGPERLPWTREIEVYRGSAGATDAAAAKFLFLHSPLWAVVPASDGTIYVRTVKNPVGIGERWWVRFALSNSAVRTILTDELRNSQSVKTLPAVRLDLISVNVYRVRGAQLRCFASTHPEMPLATGTLTGDNAYGEIRVAQLDVPQPDEFRALVKAGDARCNVTYQTLSRQLSMATSILTYQEKVTEMIEREERIMRERRQIGFASDRDRIKQQMSNDIRLFTVANSATALAALPRLEGLTAQLFRTSNFDFSKPDTRKELIESYLKADARTVTENQSEVEKTVAKNSTEAELAIGDESFKMSPKTKTEFERTHELTLTKGKTTNNVVPGSITLYQLKDNWREVLAQGVSQLVMTRAVADVGTTLEVDLSLTADVATKSLGAPTPLASSPTSLLPGAAFCYFGQMPLPADWAVLDGTQKWPLDAWVPQHLRGRQMPDMRGAMALGTGTPTDVGATKHDTSLRAPSWEVYSKSFAYAVSPDPSGPPLVWRNRNNAFYTLGPYDLVVPPEGNLKPVTVEQAPFYPVASPSVWSLAPNAQQSVVITPHKWMRVGVLSPGPEVPNLSSAPAVPWTDANRPPFTKCQWVVKL